jgi:putative acetyltransferase
MPRAMIRRARLADAAAMFAVHMAAIRVLAASHYSPQQLQAWCGDRSADSYISSIENKVVLVAISPLGSVCGFGQLNEPAATVEAVYVAPEAVRKGIGRKLLALLEAHAFAASVPSLQLDSSLNAVAFYDKAGYAPVCKTLHELAPGTFLPCVTMRKSLLPPST